MKCLIVSSPLCRLQIVHLIEFFKERKKTLLLAIFSPNFVNLLPSNEAELHYLEEWRLMHLLTCFQKSWRISCYKRPN